MQSNYSEPPRLCRVCRQPILGRRRPGQLYCSKKCYGASRTQPIADRFWAKVQIAGPDDCWLWIGSYTIHGYGHLHSTGRHGPTLHAHRVSWELAHGPIPDGLLVRHTCHTKHCVNPRHLIPGTHRDNLRDRLDFGRRSRMPDNAPPRVVLPQPQGICTRCGKPFTMTTGQARRGRRFCSVGCARDFRYGDDPAARFWAKVERGPAEACWLWQAGLHRSGYGSLTVNGIHWDTHRYAWFLTHGPIPQGMVVMHLCDTRSCCNPAHLRLGTQGDNVRDCVSKGRFKLPNPPKHAH